MQPWIRQYSPKTLKEVAGQENQIKFLQDYVENYKKQKKKSIILSGPFGTGKTSSVYALAEDSQLEVIEINASDTRSQKALHELIGSALGQHSLFSKGKIILVDELDGVSGTKDRGAIPELLKLMEKSTFPIICTMNNVWDRKFSKLRKKCEVLDFDKLDHKIIADVLKNISKKEKIDYEESAIQQLARESDGDLRAAINDLQVLGSDRKLKKAEIDEHFQRQNKVTVQEALFKIFKTKNLDIALPAFDNVDENVDKLLLWMDENIPREYKKNPDIANAFDALSLADVFFGRIRRWQHYRFYVYIYNLLSAGISLAKKEKYSEMTKYKETSRLLKIWMANQKNFKKKSIAEKIAHNTHTSTKRALGEVHYLKYVFGKNKKESEKISDYLELNSEEVDWLRK